MNRIDDEAMLRDIHHVSHRDGMREGVWTFSLVLGGLLFLYSQFPVSLPVYPVSLIIIVVSVLSGLWVKRRIARAAALPEHTREIVSRRAHDARASRETEVQKKIEEARASGAFDRWDSKDT